MVIESDKDPIGIQIFRVRDSSRRSVCPEVRVSLRGITVCLFQSSLCGTATSRRLFQSPSYFRARIYNISLPAGIFDLVVCS